MNHRTLERFQANPSQDLVVSGSRKLCCVKLTSKKLSVFEMDAVEEEDEDEDEDPSA